MRAIRVLLADGKAKVSKRTVFRRLEDPLVASGQFVSTCGSGCLAPSPPQEWGRSKRCWHSSNLQSHPPFASGPRGRSWTWATKSIC